MRLIDADHLKKWILARWQERNPQTDRPLKAIEILDQIGREMTFKEPHWIPCSSGEMPEEGQIVLATHLGGIDPNRQVIEHIYSDGKFLLNWEMDMDMLSPTFGQRYMGKVVAWMPLPEPWRGDAE